jgi:hypothetical protein
MATNYSLALHAMTQVSQRKTLSGNKHDYELLSHSYEGGASTFNNTVTNITDQTVSDTTTQTFAALKRDSR